MSQSGFSLFEKICFFAIWNFPGLLITVKLIRDYRRDKKIIADAKLNQAMDLADQERRQFEHLFQTRATIDELRKMRPQ